MNKNDKTLQEVLEELKVLKKKAKEENPVLMDIHL